MSKVFISIVIIVTLAVIGAIWFFTKSSEIVSPSEVASSSSLELNTTDETKNTATTSEDILPATTTNKTSTLDMNKKYVSATMHTNKGDITIEFSPKDTPNTVANFVKLAGSGFYDGVKFHRIIKDFMIQGGDPLTKDDSKMALWGTGGPGYSFADELTPNNKNNIGTIAMANSGPNTNGSQFFINVAANNFLDTKHVVFGKVVKGMDIVAEISKVKTDQKDRPVDPVIINSITLN